MCYLLSFAIFGLILNQAENTVVVEIKNPTFEPTTIRPLFEYLDSLGESPLWEYFSMKVELDPTIDFESNNALIRWLDLEEGFNDKIIVNSLAEFETHFKLIHA